MSPQKPRRIAKAAGAEAPAHVRKVVGAEAPAHVRKVVGAQAQAHEAPSNVHDRYSTALATLIDRIKEDRSVVAAILCGSLAHDTVWEKSDIDLVLITAEERRGERSSVALDAAGVHVHALLFSRGEFRKAVEGTTHNSFMHSFMAKGQLLFAHDPTVADLHARLQVIGDRDTKVQYLRAATGALACIDKARKWFVTRRDLDYTALWILYAAASIARIEIVSRKLLADREVIPQAARLSPELFRVIYTDLLNVKKTTSSVEAALTTLVGYMRERASSLFALIIEHLEDVGEARSCTELDDYFKRHYDLDDVTTACEYLAVEGLIGKASLPVRLTRRSTVDVQELAFFSGGSKRTRPT